MTRAVTQAQGLIGRTEPVSAVGTRDPFDELSPHGQAIRWLALHLHRNPDDQAAAALATELAARLGAAQRRGPSGGDGGAVPLGGSATRSGFYFPDPTGAEDPEELTAARSFPAVEGARVLHVHVRGGGFAVGGRLLTPEQFHEEVVARLGLPEGEPLIVVGCRVAAAPADGSRSAVAELARVSRRAVVGATADAFTTAAAGALSTSVPGVVTALAGVGADGRPVIVEDRPGEWVLARPDGSTQGGLGADLLASLRDGGSLAALLEGVRLRQDEEPAPPPAGTVRWSQAAGGQARATLVAWNRARELVGDGHGFSPGQVAAAMRLADGLGGHEARDQRRFEWLAQEVAGRGGFRGGLRDLFGLLVLAVRVFGELRADLEGLRELRRLADVAQAGRGPGDGRGAVTEGELEDVFRRVWEWPEGEQVTSGDLREHVAVIGQASRARPGLVSDRPVSVEELAGLAAAGAAGRVADHLAGRALLPVAWQQALVMQLLAGPEEHRDAGLVRELLTGADGELLRQQLDSDPEAAVLVRALGPGDPAGDRGAGQAEAMRVLVDRLLAPGHGFSARQLGAAARMAGRLALPGEGVERFRRLAREVGRGTRAIELRELVEALALADSVFGADGTDLADLENMRRLADVVRRGFALGRRGRAVTAVDLEVVFRRVWGWPADEPVAAAYLRGLVRLMGQAKEAKGAHRRVSQDDLARLAAAGGRGGWPCHLGRPGCPAGGVGAGAGHAAAGAAECRAGCVTW